MLPAYFWASISAENRSESPSAKLSRRFVYLVSWLARRPISRSAKTSGQGLYECPGAFAASILHRYCEKMYKWGEILQVYGCVLRQTCAKGMYTRIYLLLIANSLQASSDVLDPNIFLKVFLIQFYFYSLSF